MHGSSFPRVGSVAASLLAIAGAASPAHAATFFAQTFAHATADAVELWHDNDEASQTKAVPSAEAHAHIETPTNIPGLLGSDGRGTSNSLADLKFVQGEGIGDSSTLAEFSSASGDGTGNARSTVDITFLSPDVPVGTPVTLYFDIQVAGAVSASTTPAEGADPFAVAQVVFHLDVGATRAVDLTGYIDAASIPSPPIVLDPGTYSYQVTWENGATLPVVMYTSATGYGVCGASGGEAAATSSFSFAWGGVTSVTAPDATRSVLTNYSFTDELGNDWTTPYQAPAPGALALLGFFSVSRRRR